MSATVLSTKVAAASGGFGLNHTREYVLVQIVQTSSPGDGALTVLGAAGVPRRGYCYAFGNEYDVGSLCRNVVPRQVAKQLWEVTSQFSTRTEDPERQDENPLLRPPEVVWSGLTEREPYERDVDGKATNNAAGDPFDPPLERDRTRMVLSITRNEAAFDHQLAESYADALNADTFYGYAPGTAKMSAPRARYQYENGVGFWQVSYEIHFNRSGWDDERANMGCKHFEWVEEEADPVKRKVYAEEDDGIKSTAPVHLRADGFRLSLDELAASGPNYITFHPYERRLFSPLNLGGSSSEE